MSGSRNKYHFHRLTYNLPDSEMLSLVDLLDYFMKVLLEVNMTWKYKNNGATAMQPESDSGSSRMVLAHNKERKIRPDIKEAISLGPFSADLLTL